MSALRMGWRRFRGWWLVVLAAVVVAVVSAIAQVLPVVWAAVAAAPAAAVAAVLSERGRAALESGAERSREPQEQLYSIRNHRLPRVSELDDPVAVGVHPAAASPTLTGGVNRVPPFVQRDRSVEVEAALRRGRGLVLLVGESTAGKSRAAFEAMRACLPGHTFICPRDRSALPAAIAAVQERRSCVVWLDDLERYLGFGGLTGHLLARLLGKADRQVVVLATMRAQERALYSPRRDAGGIDPGERDLVRAGREVLDLAVEIRLDRRWSLTELEQARRHVDDWRIAAALDRAGRFGLAEYLAAGPQLLAEWQDAWSPAAGERSLPAGGPRGAALVAAAVDARRAGYHEPLPESLLRQLHEHYLRARGGAALRPEPWEQALAWATQPVHATSSLLLVTDQGGYLAFDYLPDAVDADPAAQPVPDPTWRGLIDHTAAPAAATVGWAAFKRHHLDHANTAFEKAVAGGDVLAAAGLAETLGTSGREREAVGVLAQAITEASVHYGPDTGEVLGLRQGLVWWTGQSGDETAARRLAEALVIDSQRVLGETHRRTLSSRVHLARRTGATGDIRQALQLAQRVAADCRRLLDQEDYLILMSRFEVAVWTGQTGDVSGAIQQFGALLDDAIRMLGADSLFALDSRMNLVWWMGQSGATAEAQRLAEIAVAESRRHLGDDHPRALHSRMALARWTGKAGNPAEALRQATTVLAASQRLLGEDHPITLDGRFEVAVWTGGDW